MTESNNNITSSRGGSTNFLAEIADEIGEALINNPQLKSLMIKHTKKVIQKAEEYGQYLRTEWQKAKEAGLTQYDKNKNKNKEEWYWWTCHSKDFSRWEECVYFADDECLHVHFYMNEKPKPDPLSYLSSMIWGSVGKDYNGLELLDYQFVLLAIIRDAQNWQAGRKRIYFNPLKKKTLSDRLCRAVWHHLESKIDSYNFRDVKNTIITALQTIKASVEQETKKQKTGWGKKIGVGLLVIVPTLALLFGDNILGRISKEFKSNKPAIDRIKTPNLSGNSVDVSNVVFETRPTADEIIEESIESIPSPDCNNLDEKVISRRIHQEYLLKGKVNESLALASCLVDTVLRDAEYVSIFEYCLKREMLGKCRGIIELISSNDAKRECETRLSRYQGDLAIEALPD